MYTEQDVEAVIYAQRINNWIGNARADHLGREARANPTPEAAIRDEAADVDERLSGRELARRLARYEHGQALNRRFVLVESGRQVEATDRAERFFREQHRVSGPVVWHNAGHAATSPRYVAFGLRPR